MYVRAIQNNNLIPHSTRAQTNCE